MNDQKLGRLTPVELRDIWLSEAADFTPWLAKPENLAVLADALGIELELEAQEKAVGPFRADILCKDIGTGDWVLIENQLERTDHLHLGQLLTYASGLQAVTIVWIASRFTDEHRSTLDWLNQITDESFSFFGLEVELWRIGDSPPAPKFNMASKPNDWSRSVARAARAIDETNLSETQLLQLRYWADFNAVLDGVGGPVRGNRKPQPASWMDYGIGRTNFSLQAATNSMKKEVRAELWIGGEHAKEFFWLLRQDRESIEEELGFKLIWEPREGKKNCRISTPLADIDPESDESWPRQHEWLARHLNRMHQVFAKRIRALDVHTSHPADLDEALPAGDAPSAG